MMTTEKVSHNSATITNISSGILILSLAMPELASQIKAEPSIPIRPILWNIYSNFESISGFAQTVQPEWQTVD